MLRVTMKGWIPKAVTMTPEKGAEKSAPDNTQEGAAQQQEDSALWADAELSGRAGHDDARERDQAAYGEIDAGGDDHHGHADGDDGDD